MMSIKRGRLGRNVGLMLQNGAVSASSGNRRLDATLDGQRISTFHRRSAQGEGDRVLRARGSAESAAPICGLFCRYKKSIVTALLIFLPIVVIVFAAVAALFSKAVREARRKLLVVTAKEGSPFFVDLLGPSKDSELSKNRHSEDVGRFGGEEEQEEMDFRKETFNNPLVLGAEIDEASELTKLDGEKVRLKFKSDELFCGKLKALKKLSVLASEADTLRENIYRLKKMQGLNAFKEKQRIEEEPDDVVEVW